jgi:signal transduction histidine kinase
MRCGNVSVCTASLRLLAAVGFVSTSIFVLGIRAQSAVPLEQPSGVPLLVTNLQQLGKLLDSSSRIIGDVRLDVVVCSASRAELGVVAVMDKTGSEIFELGPRNVSIAPGDIVHIEHQRCLIRRREIGVEITRAPDVDDDGEHGLQKVTAEVSLTAGLHAFQLDYFNLLGAYGLELTCRLPDGSLQKTDQFLVKPNGSVVLESNLAAGVNAAYYEGAWFTVPDFALLQPVKTMTTTNLSVTLGPQREMFGIRFSGFFSAPMNGKYTFNLESDDGSLLFLDAPEVPWTTIGHEDVPSAIFSSLHAPTTDPESSKWMTVEGRVVFVSRIGKGLRFELRSQPDSIWGMVADGRELDPTHLLNSRIRVTGVGRSVITPGREKVLGELSIATADDIEILEASRGAIAASGPTPTLVAVGQIQSLSKEEATRHLPVRIHGVVTSLAPSMFQYMSVQDETRGVFVQLPASVGSGTAVGQLCDVIGYTAPGDFAPIVVAEDVIVLGKGQMPSPARPTWKELINGSMDVQWVEIQGLVTAVESNSLALLLPEGVLHIEAGACFESELRPFEKALIRIRGVLFAVWNTNRTVQVGNLVMRNVIIGVEAPAPRDPFDVAKRSWSELYQFDARATPFQRVKVRGTAIYADSIRVFMMDKGRGIRVSPVEAPNVQFGEEVEVVGYPDISGPAPLLREAVLRKTGQTTDPLPRILDGNELMQENVDSTLVRISATLMGIHSEQDSHVLEMNAHGHLFLARMPRTKESASLRVGSKLALTGVYVGKAATWSEGNKPSGFELILSSPSQLIVLSEPSWWTPKRLLVMVGWLLVVLTLATIWISQLRRLVEQRTQQLQGEIREREAAERERALETERSRIARDLHDDLGCSLTEIGALASKGQRSDRLEELTALFGAISAKARGLVSALDVIVWAVDPKDNSLESVADYLSGFASDYLSDSGIVCRFDIPVALPSIVLDGHLRHQLLLAVKETLNNVVRHSQATEVEFRMAFAGDQLQIIISDNGKGFDAKKKQGGNGLKNLPLRLSELGGRYSIESSVGNGTIITIVLRLSQQTEIMPARGRSLYDVQHIESEEKTL